MPAILVPPRNEKPREPSLWFSLGNAAHTKADQIELDTQGKVKRPLTFANSISRAAEKAKTSCGQRRVGDLLTSQSKYGIMTLVVL